MFHRSGTQNRFEITAPPNELASKLKLQHPPPALLLSESRSEHRIGPATTKQPVQRFKSYPAAPNEKFSISMDSSRFSEKHSKKKNMFSFRKKKHKTQGDPPPRGMSKTPENFGRKQISYDPSPGSVPTIRRPHSSASDRHNGTNRYHLSGDEDETTPTRIGYPRQRPARVAPPIPTQRDNGYDSLNNYRRLSQSEDGSLMGSSSGAQSLSLSDVPGLIGIRNHGNTCFMNAIVQCLSNTEPLLRYIITGGYRGNLKGRRRTKSLSTPSSPSHNVDTLLPTGEGVVTECVALLIKSLWNAQYESKISQFTREVVGVWGRQYRGAGQHDAQEFLLWLLDRLHEDLNEATGERVTIKSPGNNSHIEEGQAAETLIDHLQRHDSLIYNLFSAQYHSSLRCPSCLHYSNTFDPYLCISLSVPRRGTRPIYVTMARRHQNSTRLMVFGLSMKVNCTVRDIQRQLSIEARTLPHYLVLGDMKQDGFYRFFRPTDPISAIGEYSTLYAYEVTPYKGEFTPSLPHPPAVTGGETIYVILQCRVGQGEYSRRFGSPMCLRVWRDVTYSQLQSVVFKNMRDYLHDGVNPEVVCRDYIFFKCLVLEGLQGQEYLDPYCPAPFMCPSVEKALSLSKVWGYEPHIKVVAEWEQWVKDTVCIDVPDIPDDPAHPSVQLIHDHYSNPVEAPLEECLEWHTKQEKLEEGETYQCQQCGQAQEGATKRISFWTLPDVMVLHLKRFEVDEYSQSKLGTFIRYPVRGLDMTPYLAHPEQTRPSSAMGFREHALSTSGSHGNSVREKKSSKDSLEKRRSSNTLPLKGAGFEDLRKTDHTHLVKSKQKFIWKKSKKPKHETTPTSSATTDNTRPSRDSNLYDLYAVCCHYGNMESGHYVSHCCNPVDGRWYMFDDHKVSPMATAEGVVSQHAYVLFYTRRGAKNRYSLSGCGQGEEHWIHKVPPHKLDLSRIIPAPPEVPAGKAQRQGSALTLSTVGGISPDNSTHTSPPRVDVAPPTGTFPLSSPPSSYHAPQLSNGSSGGVPISPSHSAVGYPSSIPSPSAHSTVSTFSHMTQPFTNRTGSYHGNSHHGHTHKSNHDPNTRTATRL